MGKGKKCICMVIPLLSQRDKVKSISPYQRLPNVPELSNIFLQTEMCNKQENKDKSIK